MKLRETTKKMITQLEQKSGYIVHVREDPNLPVISNIVTARGNLLAHIITYNPGLKNESSDINTTYKTIPLAEQSTIDIVLLSFNTPPPPNLKNFLAESISTWAHMSPRYFRLPNK